MNDRVMYVDSDAATHPKELQYRKKRPKSKPKDLYSSCTDDRATTEDENEDGIIVTDDDILSPQKSTAQIITVVRTESATRTEPFRRYCNPNEAVVIRPYGQKVMAFQSFPLPAKHRSDLVVSNSIVADSKRTISSKEAKRRNANVLRKMPLYRMKTDLKRQLTKLEKRLGRIKKNKDLKRSQSAHSPSPPIKTPIHLTGLFSTKKRSTLNKSSVIPHSYTSKRRLSTRDIAQKISENPSSLKNAQHEIPLPRDRSKMRSVSSKRTSKSILQKSPQPEKGSSKKKDSADEDDIEHEEGSRVKDAKQAEGVKRVKKGKKTKRKPKKQKANLRGFRQQIPIEGTDCTMEIILEPELIEKTRTGNIDFTKAPLREVRTNKATDLRDEYSAYCGQKKYIKNWLFQV